MASLIKCLAPIETQDSNVLILGSMPSITSIKNRQYYAHPQNQFWQIIQKIIGVTAKLNYSNKIKMLNQAKIALWDMLASCIRPGSADSKITNGISNDINNFLQTHPDISKICLNGITAANYFRIYQNNNLNSIFPKKRNLQICKLPSTSPANARISFNQKYQIWRSALTN